MRCAKAARSTRESYGDSAIGYVQVKRTEDHCVVVGTKAPEHNVTSKSYEVTAVIDEKLSEIASIECSDCVALAGGCKHSLAFVAWLHRRSEDPTDTELDCY